MLPRRSSSETLRRITASNAGSGRELLFVALAALLACSKVRDIKRDGGDEGSAVVETDAGKDGGSADDMKQQMQVQVQAKLRECGVISRDGMYRSSPHPADHYICPNSCFLRASCAEAKADWCRTVMPPMPLGQRQPELAECMLKCFAETVYCGATLRNVARCDDKIQCPDGSDEADCDYFVCESGERINFLGRCDGEEQCGDGSDEEDCTPSFECDDGEVPRGYAECDGVAHCLDESDERGCIERGLVVECAGGGWVPTSAVCNGRPDCGDGSDEMQGCARNLCDPR